MLRPIGKPALAAILAGLFIGAGSAASAGEFVGLDPYNRPVYADPGPVPIVPSAVSGPVYRRGPGEYGGPLVAGPLYYATPAPPVPGFYRDDPHVKADAILAYDLDAALASAAEMSRATRKGVRPPPFSGEWYRYCEARYRSFDRDSGTFQPSTGPRRLCR